MKKVLSMILCFVSLFAVFNIAVFAEEETGVEGLHEKLLARGR